MLFQKILVAIENSSLDHFVFNAALELGRSNQAVLRLVHCIANEIVPTPMSNMPFETTTSPSLLLDNYQTQQTLIEGRIEEAQAVLKGYCEEALLQNVATESDYQIGEAGHQLCDAAKDWGADLIVVGRRGRTGLAEALLGSVSNYVVHHAPCSVLVIQEVEPVSPAAAVTDSSSTVTYSDLNQEPV